MQEKDRENIALFRYGLIAPLLNNQAASKKDYLAEICSQVHHVPFYGAKEYHAKTVDEWLRIYRRFGFEGLKPKRRSDLGKSRIIPIDIQERILNLRQENNELPVSMFYDTLIQKGIIMRKDFSYSTVYRFLKKHNLLGKLERKEPQRKRFAYETVNILWQTDGWHGPYIKVGAKKKPTYLLAFIDDCSRLVTGSRFSFTENTEDLMKVFEEALLRRGLPKMIYADNGKIFRSDQFHLACASLGITLIHTRPYDPASKGKIERVFGTIAQKFMPLFKQEDINSLEDLNKFFWQWLEKDYHRKVHSAINMTPLDKYLSQMSQVKLVDDPESLRVIFLKRENRKVRHDGTISLKNKLFEVPPQFIGQRIELRFDENLRKVLIYSDGKEVAQATSVNMADNAKVKRDKPALCFSELSERLPKGGDS